VVRHNATTGNHIRGNIIGPDVNGAEIIGSSQDVGISFEAASGGGPDNNVIGGATLADSNLIAYNTVAGVDVGAGGTTADFNLISHNIIFENGGKGIDLDYSTNQANSNIQPPTVDSVSATTIWGRSVGATDIIEVYIDDQSASTCTGQDARRFAGITTAVAGSWVLGGLSVNVGDSILATATDASNNTSEFSICNVGLPVSLLNFTAEFEDGVIVSRWETASELNNDYFTVFRSRDVQNWEEVARVKGAGTTNSSLNYVALDNRPWTGTTYYRLTQTDQDGTYKIYNPVAVDVKAITLSNIYPNPSTKGEISFQIEAEGEEITTVEILDMTGKVVYNRTVPVQRGVNVVVSDVSEFSAGIYILKLSGNKRSINVQRRFAIE